MGLFRATGNTVKNLFNIRSWFSYDQLKEQTQGVGCLASSIWRTATTKDMRKQETFEEVQARLKLNEKDLQRLARQLFWRAVFFMVFGFFAFIYALYLMFSTGLLSGLAMIILSFVIFAVGVFAHFNLYRLKQRKLKCSFKVYFRSLFSG